uniref:Syntaxin 6/10/61 N-terminal domain-containing protein n=1 Tax=Kalanchoe fedtschenkoi TaxID=63787 RepID=A0A7N0R9V5_KALFE
MATNFDRWEKDPFFPAAEEVQESADRMESAYRTWLHSVKDSSGVWDSEQLSRDLQTTLGTAKWQLEEFSRAVRSSYKENSDEDRKRHRDFIHAIEDQIATVDKSLAEASAAEGKSPRPWVRLDERERNELALFLSAGPRMSQGPDATTNLHQNLNDGENEGLRNVGFSVEHGGLPPKGGKTNGHRRTASAGADMEAWKISVADDAYPAGSNSCRPDPPPRRIPSVLGLLSTMGMESASKFSWPVNGYRKLKVADSLESDLPPLPRGVKACYEKSKSCLNSCDECYDRRFYGWCGAAQRLLQRSQYHMQYSRPVQIAFWIALLCLVAGLLALCII